MDPELEAFIPLFPRADMTDPVAAREKFAGLAAAVPAPDIAGLEVEDRTVPARPDVPVRIYRPHPAQGAVVWLHGGGFVMGGLDTEHPWATRIADGSGAVVISVGYRLAPEHPFPAAPARATDLSGLPPAYIATAEYCPNRDEDIHYALRLLQAGVAVELHQWPGTFHGSQAILSAENSAVLRRALAE
ncbi:alpha/beta hydrolase [Streptomyces sp. NPDC002537]